MIDSLTTLGSNLVVLAVFLGVVVVALLIARSVFGTVSVRSTAVEAAARLTSLPTATPGALRRRFARAVTSQHVVMPSGERHAHPRLVVRLSPEDAERLAPEGELAALERDAVQLYLKHAGRNQWKVPADVQVAIEIDPVLRPGWIPPARGVGRPIASESVASAPTGTDADRAAAWARVASARSVSLATEDTGPITATWTAAQAEQDREPATVAVGRSGIELVGPDGSAHVETGSIVVLGRGDQSPVRLTAPEVSGRHAAVRHRGGDWEIRDLGSTNGTVVDGERLSTDAWRPFRPGSTIEVAGVRLTVRADAFGTVPLLGGQ